MFELLCPQILGDWLGARSSNKKSLRAQTLTHLFVPLTSNARRDRLGVDAAWLAGPRAPLTALIGEKQSAHAPQVHPTRITASTVLLLNWNYSAVGRPYTKSILRHVAGDGQSGTDAAAACGSQPAASACRPSREGLGSRNASRPVGTDLRVLLCTAVYFPRLNL